MTQNRRAAFSCLQGVVYKDDSCIEAFELIQKYRLYSKQRFEELIERLSIVATFSIFFFILMHTLFISKNFYRNLGGHLCKFFQA